MLLKEIDQLEVSVEEVEVDSVEEEEVVLVEEIEEDMEEIEVDLEVTREIQETQLSFLVKMIKTPKKVPLEPSKVKKWLFDNI